MAVEERSGRRRRLAEKVRPAAAGDLGAGTRLTSLNRFDSPVSGCSTLSALKVKMQNLLVEHGL